MTWRVALRLGRVSNLPTVWTNVTAGVVLAGGHIDLLPFSFLLVAFSLFYVAGMYLNDAFDRDYDARVRPERPIPSAQISTQTVFTVGFTALAAGEGLIAVVGMGLDEGQGWMPVASGMALVLTILYYNTHHKANPVSPIVIAFCRVLVYVTTALAVAPKLPNTVFWGSLCLLAYVVGLSYAARQENLKEFRNLWPLACLGVPFLYGAPGILENWAVVFIYLGFFVWVVHGVFRFVVRQRLNVPLGVSILIAGISFLDGLLIANQGREWIALLTVGGVLVTRLLQRFVPGT